MPSRSSVHWRGLVWMAVAIAAVEAVVVAAVFAIDRWRLDRESRGWFSRGGPPVVNDLVIFQAPGIPTPPTVPDTQAELADDEEILGVVAGGQPRAYRLRALSTEVTHVLNDLVGGVPVTVTYCDVADCARAFTAEGRDRPLDLAVGGLLDARRLILEVHGHRYFQDDRQPVPPATSDASSTPAPPFPYDDFPLIRTTWKAWRTAHPQTDVFLGTSR